MFYDRDNDPGDGNLLTLMPCQQGGKLVVTLKAACAKTVSFYPALHKLISR